MIAMTTKRVEAAIYFIYNGINVFYLDLEVGGIFLFELSQKDEVELIRNGLQINHDKHELILDGVIH